LKIDEFYPLFKKAKDSKDTGGFHDFVEILKLYDKNEDSTILENELFRLLTNLGKRHEKQFYNMLKSVRVLDKDDKNKNVYEQKIFY